MLEYISVSQINAYIGCSLKYKFKYIDKLSPAFTPSALAFGSSVHAAIEWMHKLLMTGNRDDVLKALSIFDADWYASCQGDIRFKSKESQKSLKQIGLKMLKFYDEQLPESKIVAVEQSFTVPIVDHSTGETLDTSLYGIIDLVLENHLIVDFKTAAKALLAVDVDSSLQMTAYSYAYNYKTGQIPSLRIDALYKTKEPKIDRIPTTRTEKDYVKLFNLAKAVIFAIEAGVFYPISSWRCNDCEFKKYCWLWNGKVTGKGADNVEYSNTRRTSANPQVV
ncbi:MAG: PD-(D/E)XK nuclease family protein [Deferribacteres bacterium]|nr:PD-(D/E)XK nuclease family protein [candidate division KSB1 bacterium]MCB9503072.1 PD-(D/E)XK nuclease family protein [Deferribacteres bacterium]